MESKKFVFEFVVKGVPYNKETCDKIYGGGYNSDIGEESHASMLAYQILQDAFAHNTLALLSHVADCKCDPENMTDTQKHYYHYLEKKCNVVEFAMKSFKFSHAEK